MKRIIFGSIIVLSNSILFAMEQKSKEIDLGGQWEAGEIPKTPEYRVNAKSELDKLLIDSFNNLNNLPAIRELLKNPENLSEYSLDLAILANHHHFISALLEAKARPSKYSRLLIYLVGYPACIEEFNSKYPKIPDEVQLPENRYSLFVGIVSQDFSKTFLWVSKNCPDLLEHLILWPLTVKLVLNKEVAKYQDQLDDLKHEIRMCQRGNPQVETTSTSHDKHKN